MKLLLKLFIITFFVFLLLSCGATCRINVNGYLNPNFSFNPQPVSSFYIVQNPSASNPLLEKEVASKIDKLLKERGYRLSTQENSDFHILFNYGIDKGPLEVGTITYREPDTTKTVYSYNYSTGQWDWVQVNIPGSTRQETYSVQHHTRSLSVKVIDANESKKTGNLEVAWIGDAVSEGTSSDLRDVINYLLIATFEYFGQDTGKAAQVSISAGDPRIKSIK